MSNSKATVKKIGLISCIATGIGCIIGSGIFGSLPTVINDIGPSVIIALIGAVIYTLAKMIPNVYVSAVVPTSGSFFVAPTKLVHPALGMFMAAQNLLQPVLVSVFAVLFADYFVALFPALAGKETIVSIGILIVYAILGYLGNHTFASINSIMVGVLLVAMALYIFVGVPNIQPERLTMSGILAPGIRVTTLGAAIAVLSSSLSGGASITQIADDVKNPRRNIPLALILAPTLVAVIYILMAVVTLGAMTTPQITTLAEVGGNFLSRSLLTFFIVGGPLFGVLTSMVPVIMLCCAQIQAASDCGLFPSFVGKKNKYGIAPASLGFVMLFAILLCATGSTFGVLMTIFSFVNCVGDIVLCILPFFLKKRYPYACLYPGFKLPSWMVNVLSIFAVCVAAYLSFSALATLDAVVWILIAAFAVLFFLYMYLRLRYLKKFGSDLIAELKAPYAPWEAREAECKAMSKAG